MRIYDKIHSFSTGKKIRNTLATTQESIYKVKEIKITMLVHQYEMFKKHKHEPIYFMFRGFIQLNMDLDSQGERLLTKKQGNGHPRL